jgi:hypothetical protein
MDSETAPIREPRGFVICAAGRAWFFVLRMISVLDGQQGAPAPEENDAGADTGGSGNALVLAMSVLGCAPPIWRRVVVREDMWLQQLHDVIQVAFDWFDYQTHEFVVGEARYGNPFKREDVTIEDDRDVTLEDIDLAVRETISYQYHFGEGWGVEIRVEKVIPVEKGAAYPSCEAGARAGPPEDCGGVEAYHDMLECLKEPHTELCEDWREWLGPEYDPERCDLKASNKFLAGVVSEGK